MKVRYETKCVKCRGRLAVGARAMRLHGALWCMVCAGKHRVTCSLDLTSRRVA